MTPVNTQIGQWSWWKYPPGVLRSAALDDDAKLRQATFCSTTHIALAVALQTLLRAGLRPPWSSWDGLHRARLRVTGYLNSETLAAVWAYLSRYGMSQLANDFRSRMRPTPRFTATDTALLVWLSYYTNRYSVADNGTVSQSPPLLSDVALSDLVVTATPEVMANSQTLDADRKFMEWSSWPQCMNFEEYMHGPTSPTVAAKSKGWDANQGAIAALEETSNNYKIAAVILIAAAIWDWTREPEKPPVFVIV